MRLIPLDGFLVVNIQLVRMANDIFLHNYLPHPDVSSLQVFIALIYYLRLLSFSHQFFTCMSFSRTGAVLCISVRWWFFTGVWVTASLFKSPGLSSVLLPSSIMLSFGCFPLVCQLPNPPGPLIILQSLCQKHQSQLVQSTLSCSIVS